ncbi:hypothetical protein HDV00_007251 [Rhizophlyctis rosea]|nr:hypothetical protein HDV00_007251 [Rhizophlyctis rosea]
MPNRRGISSERVGRAVSTDTIGMLEHPFANNVLRQFGNPDLPGDTPTTPHLPPPLPRPRLSPVSMPATMSPATPPLDPTIIQKWSQIFFRPNTIRSVLSAYFSHFYWYLLGSPNHPPTFFQTFQHQLSHRPFFIYAMAALSAPWADTDCAAVRYFCDEERLPLWQAGDVYYSGARSMVASVLEEECLEHVIGLGCLAVYARERGELSTSFRWIGMAMRMATSLQFNVDPDVVEVHGRLTWLQKESRRRVWLGMCLEEFVGTMMVDRPVSGQFENLLRLEDSTAPQPSTQSSLFFPQSGLFFPQDPLPPQRPIRPPTAVKPYSNESVWLSVKTLDGEPSSQALMMANEVDPTKSLIYLAGLYSKCLSVCGIVTKFLKSRGSIETQTHSPLPPTPYTFQPDQASTTHTLFPTQPNDPTSPAQQWSPNSLPSARDLQSSRLSLQKELEEFRQSLPEWLRDVDKYPGDDPTRVQRYPIYHAMCLHIVWNAAMLVLWFPVALEGSGGDVDAVADPDPVRDLGLELGPEPKPLATSGSWGSSTTLGGGASSSSSGSTNSLHSDSYSHCLKHAFQVSSILDAMGPESGIGMYPGYYLAWIIYHPAVILSLEAHRRGNGEEGHRVTVMVEKIIKVMREMGRRSFVAGVIADNTERGLRSDGNGWDGRGRSGSGSGIAEWSGWNTI